MLQLADLLANFFNHIWMAVPDRHGDDAGEAIEIALARFVPKILHLAFDQEQRVAVIRDQPRRQVLLTQRDDFLLAWPRVGFRRMLANGQLGQRLR